MKETGPGARERMKFKRKQDKQTEFKTNKQKKYVHRSIIYTYTIFTRYLHSDINTAYAHTHTELGHPVPQPLSPRASALRRFGRTEHTHYQSGEGKQRFSQPCTKPRPRCPAPVLELPLPHGLEEVFPGQLVSPHALLLPQVFLHHSLEWSQGQTKSWSRCFG